MGIFLTSKLQFFFSGWGILPPPLGALPPYSHSLRQLGALPPDPRLSKLFQPRSFFPFWNSCVRCGKNSLKKQERTKLIQVNLMMAKFAFC